MIWELRYNKLQSTDLIKSILNETQIYKAFIVNLCHLEFRHIRKI